MKPIPKILKKRFEPCKGRGKNNVGVRKLGKPNVFDKNGKKKAGQYKRKVADEPSDVLYDQNGNKLDGKYNKEKPNLFGEELYDQNGNKLDGTYKQIMSDEPHVDLPGVDAYDKNGKK